MERSGEVARGGKRLGAFRSLRACAEVQAEGLNSKRAHGSERPGRGSAMELRPWRPFGRSSLLKACGLRAGRSPQGRQVHSPELHVLGQRAMRVLGLLAVALAYDECEEDCAFSALQRRVRSLSGASCAVNLGTNIWQVMWHHLCHPPERCSLGLTIFLPLWPQLCLDLCQRPCLLSWSRTAASATAKTPAGWITASRKATANATSTTAGTCGSAGSVAAPRLKTSCSIPWAQESGSKRLLGFQFLTIF